MHIPVPFVNFFDRSNQWLYALTKGHVGGQLLMFSMLLLQTVGRKTGQTRTHTLLYLKDGENMLICASNDGQAHYPAWYWNLQADARARVQAGRLITDVVAREVKGEEYEQLWRRFLKATSLYADHRTRTDRHFPIFVLTPVAAEELLPSTPAGSRSEPV